MSSKMNDLSKFSQYLSLMVSRVPGLSVHEKTARISGEDHSPVFACELSCGAFVAHSCASKSKKIAKHDAARSLVNNPDFSKWIEMRAVRPMPPSARLLGVQTVINGEELRERIDRKHIAEFGHPPMVSVCKSGTCHRCVVVYGPHYIRGCGESMAGAITNAYVVLDRALCAIEAAQAEENEVQMVCDEVASDSKDNKQQENLCNDEVDVPLVAPCAAVKPQEPSELSGGERGCVPLRCCASHESRVGNNGGCHEPRVSPIKRTSTNFHVGEVKHDGSFKTELFRGSVRGELVEYDKALMSKYKALALDCDVLCDRMIDDLSPDVCAELRREVDAVYIHPTTMDHFRTGRSRIIEGWARARLKYCIVPHLLRRRAKDVVLITSNSVPAYVEGVAATHGIRLCVLDTEYKVRMWLYARRSRMKDACVEPVN